MNKDHALLRQTFEWKSRGKLHDEGVTSTLLKDMSDSHLLHVIGWVLNHSSVYGSGVAKILLNEAAYRSANYIFVDE